ncbi:uncharacterized protein LOC143193496 [Rhynchophorus ferrugineus]|uniref:uncharacterized protein LOC143193496 n=1 Tax=Rhynchophorus ferrugineus TaxID=354439 RepID=UPI003FCD9474
MEKGPPTDYFLRISQNIYHNQSAFVYSLDHSLPCVSSDQCSGCQYSLPACRPGHLPEMLRSQRLTVERGQRDHPRLRPVCVKEKQGTHRGRTKYSTKLWPRGRHTRTMTSTRQP